MSQIVRQSVRIAGAIALAFAFLVTLFFTFSTESLSQASPSEAIANSTGIGQDILPEIGVHQAVLNGGLSVCSGTWVITTVDSAGDVGRSTSLALAPTFPYTPNISYAEVITKENIKLKYAYLSGTTWFSQTVSSGGERTSLVLVPTYPYTPCISYHDYGRWELRYACRNNTTWADMKVGGQRAGQNGVSLALEPTYPFTPHISSYCPLGGTVTLYHSYLSGTTWMSGTWVHGQVEPSGSEAGTWNSLALESTHPYTPHISYRAGATTALDLKHAWLSGTTWLSETVDSAGDVGWHTSLALDSSSNPHISYFDYTNGGLKYAWLSDTTWLSDTVDTALGLGDWWGWGTSLELNRHDVPYISYYDAVNRDLKLARFDGKTWITETADSQGDVGPFSSLALDPAGCPHISYYDATNGNLKYAYIPAKRIYLPLILKNR